MPSTSRADAWVEECRRVPSASDTSSAFDESDGRRNDAGQEETLSVESYTENKEESTSESQF